MKYGRMEVDADASGEEVADAVKVQVGEDAAPEAILKHKAKEAMPAKNAEAKKASVGRSNQI